MVLASAVTLAFNALLTGTTNKILTGTGAGSGNSMA